MSESIYTRADLIEDVAEYTGLTKEYSKASVKAAISAIVASVQRGQKVAIKEFITMESKPTKAKAARTGRNPKTGEPIQIDAKPAGKPLVDTFITEVSQDTWILFPWDTEPQFVAPIAKSAAGK